MCFFAYEFIVGMNVDSLNHNVFVIILIKFANRLELYG